MRATWLCFSRNLCLTTYLLGVIPAGAAVLEEQLTSSPLRSVVGHRPLFSAPLIWMPDSPELPLNRYDVVTGDSLALRVPLDESGASDEAPIPLLSHAQYARRAVQDALLRDQLPINGRKSVASEAFSPRPASYSPRPMAAPFSSPLGRVQSWWANLPEAVVCGTEAAFETLDGAVSAVASPELSEATKALRKASYKKPQGSRSRGGKWTSSKSSPRSSGESVRRGEAPSRSSQSDFRDSSHTPGGAWSGQVFYQ